jgi:twinkle protein
MKIYTTWEEAGIDTKRRAAGQIKVKCPQCPESRGNQRDTSLSVNLDEKLWNCHYCQWKGRLVDQEQKPKKVYKKPLFTPVPPSEKMAAWFLKYRAIEKKTLEKFFVCPIEKYIHKAGKKEPCIAFPYIRNSEIVNIKSRYDYREEGINKKTFTMESECELVFFNLDSMEGKDHVVIVEGEIDAMSVWQASENPCISVPNGASKGDLKMEYLDNCYSHFKGVQVIVIATDNDEPGQALKEELARRLGKHRCFYITWPEGCKDFNEVLVKYGPEQINEMLSEAKPFPIEGIISVESVEKQLDHYYKFGFPKGCKIGFTKFDKLLTIRGGEVTTITGIPGHGKTEWLDEMLERLANNHYWRHGLFAAENGSAALHYTRIAHRHIGKPYYSEYSEKMTAQEQKVAKTFMADRFFFINTSEVKLTIESLLNKAAEMVLRFGIKTFTIDPYNCMENQRPAGVNETEYVSHIYSLITQFAEKYDVHVFIVAHPTKISKDKKTGLFEIPTMYSISGSANFFNKTYNGISVYRDYEANLTDVYVQKVKFDFIGRTGFSSFEFDRYTRRYKEVE